MLVVRVRAKVRVGVSSLSPHTHTNTTISTLLMRVTVRGVPTNVLLYALGAGEAQALFANEG